MKKYFFHYCIFKNSPYLCTAFERNFPVRTGCSAVRLAHLLWEQGVVGSNPATPTKNSSQEKLNGVELIRFVSAFFVYVN